MTFPLPTLPELIERVGGDLTSAADGALRRSDQRALVRVHSGASHEMHGYLGWTARQILPDDCDEEMLLRHARLRLAVPRKDASAASGFVSASGAEGKTIDAGALLQADDQRRYLVVETTTIRAGTAKVQVRAVDAGVAGNIGAGVRLRFISPVVGVSDTVMVLDPGISGGTDQESVERLRQRVIRSYRLVPDGGNGDDYVTWALEVPGVTRAWCRPHYMGLGTVGVFFMRDDDLNPVPDEQACATVKAYIERQRPVTAELYVLAPKPRAIDFDIRLSPDDEATRTAVVENLSDLLEREGALGVTVLESHLRQAISGARGERDHKLLQPVDDVALQPNEIPVMGATKWQ
ncbi:TPA: baseplate J/gp47 family protein [Burkholderia vietnamiensis]|uniref:baseplate J/gp47 family protein n=1 Tax=Burkholderia vietnamiensis TaxID=60552 RepID=UPI000754BAB9|nr:baseplate J/gp47 family protein [Burkholderia vietnamiensis]KVF97036.1 baseplate J protein [Burkholderia vietnamiensis]HDR8962479.1 baseplate J/gp47 family protein [Burkholderia vietnamiensis]